MSLGFRKSYNLGGGSRINIGSRGVGFSCGTRGNRVALTTDGRLRRTMSYGGFRYTKDYWTKGGSGSYADYDNYEYYGGYDEPVCDEVVNAIAKGMADEYKAYLKERYFQEKAEKEAKERYEKEKNMTAQELLEDNIVTGSVIRGYRLFKGLVIKTIELPHKVVISVRRRVEDTKYKINNLIVAIDKCKEALLNDEDIAISIRECKDIIREYKASKQIKEEKPSYHDLVVYYNKKREMERQIRENEELERYIKKNLTLVGMKKFYDEKKQKRLQKGEILEVNGGVFVYLFWIASYVGLFLLLTSFFL